MSLYEQLRVVTVRVPDGGVSGMQGRGTGEVTARSSGRTQGQLIGNLEGTGTLTVAGAGGAYARAGGAEPIVISELGTAIEATPERVVFRDLAVKADGVPASGQIAVGFGGPRPAGSARMSKRPTTTP